MMATDTTVVSGGVDENLDDGPYASVGERRVLIQTYDYAVRTLIEMVIEGDLVLDPDYQRHYRWTDEKASKFIESVVLNIPVPVIYLAEESDGTFTVIDGQQRLTSILRFLRPKDLEDVFQQANPGRLTLSGLQVRPDLNGQSYLDISRVDQAAISKRPIRCIVVLNESDATLKFEVFERLNTGSLSLTDQEVRNCIYRGTFNTLLKKLAANERFQEMISLPAAARSTMKDAELVLRFFAYRELSETSNYSDNYTEYLNSYMEDNREIGQTHARQLEALFANTVEVIYKVLGPKQAFRKPNNRQKPFDGFATNLINGAIYESQMVAFAQAIAMGVDEKKFRGAVSASFTVEAYWESLFSGTAKRSKALKRKHALIELFTK